MARARRYRKILTGIDFSAPSRAALREAAALARQLGARLEVLHVVPQLVPTIPFVGVSRAVVGQDQERQIQASSQRLEKWLGALRDVPVEGRILVGKPPFRPHEAILEHARRSGADLIVLGHRGQNVTERLLLGSTADRVLRKASIPVLLIPGSVSRRTPGKTRAGRR